MRHNEAILLHYNPTSLPLSPSPSLSYILSLGCILLSRSLLVILLISLESVLFIITVWGRGVIRGVISILPTVLVAFGSTKLSCQDLTKIKLLLYSSLNSLRPAVFVSRRLQPGQHGPLLDVPDRDGPGKVAVLRNTRPRGTTNGPPRSVSYRRSYSHLHIPTRAQMFSFIVPSHTHIHTC